MPGATATYGTRTMKMPALRYLPILFALVIAPASTAHGANPNTRAASDTERSELAGGWHFVRIHNPSGGADAISIMHTADTSKSDLDLAGLTIRCGETNAEVIVVLLRTFPLRARPQVIFGDSGSEIKFEATVAPPGTAVLLPKDAMHLVSGSWLTMSNLLIRVDDGKTTIRGVVALVGLHEALKVLLASCFTQ